MTTPVNDNTLDPYEAIARAAQIAHKVNADNARMLTVAGAAHLLKDRLEPGAEVRVDGCLYVDVDGRKAEAAQLTLALAGRRYKLVLTPE